MGVGWRAAAFVNRYEAACLGSSFSSAENLLLQGACCKAWLLAGCLRVLFERQEGDSGCKRCSCRQRVAEPPTAAAAAAAAAQNRNRRCSIRSFRSFRAAEEAAIAMASKFTSINWRLLWESCFSAWSISWLLLFEDVPFHLTRPLFSPNTHSTVNWFPVQQRSNMFKFSYQFTFSYPSRLFLPEKLVAALLLNRFWFTAKVSVW